MTLSWDLALEIFGLILGLIYLWYEYHANARVWLVSVIMPLISMWLYYRKGLYADFAINIYYVAIAVYGYLVWTLKREPRNDDSAKKVVITDASLEILSGCAIACASLWYGIWYVLVNYTNSNVPVADAFTTALSIVALWMMARKYTQQWLAWMVVDAVSVGLYIYKGIYFYASLYAIYTVIAWFGYVKWRRLRGVK